MALSVLNTALKIALEFVPLANGVVDETQLIDSYAQTAETQKTIKEAASPLEAAEAMRYQADGTLVTDQMSEISKINEQVQEFRTALILNFGQLVSEFNAQNIVQFDRPLNYLDEPEQQEDDLLVPDFNYVNETLAA